MEIVLELANLMVVLSEVYLAMTVPRKCMMPRFSVRIAAMQMVVCAAVQKCIQANCRNTDQMENSGQHRKLLCEDDTTAQREWLSSSDCFPILKM